MHMRAHTHTGLEASAEKTQLAQLFLVSMGGW